jgi:hypothetical protein
MHRVKIRQICQSCDIRYSNFKTTDHVQGCQIVYFQTKTSQFGQILEGRAKEVAVVGIFYGHLIYFVVIWYFSPFWYVVPRKIWQP